MLSIKMAFRNLLRQKRRTVYTAISMIIGFTLAAFFIGWQDGSYNTIIDNFTRYKTGHIQIHKGNYLDSPKMYKTIRNPQKVFGALNNTEKVVSFSARIKAGGLVSLNDKSAGAQITGINPVRENKTISFKRKVTEGKYFSDNPESYECLIGKGLKRLLNAQIGDEIVVLSQAADGSIANEIFKLKGIIDLGSDFENRSAFYIKLQQAKELFVLYDQVHEIAVNIENVKFAEEVAENLKQKIGNPDLSIASWKIFAKSFYKAMKADQEGMWISLLVVIIVVAIGGLNTVLMSVLERRREYGVLKAIGTKPTQIVKLIIYENTILAIMSIVVGAVLGTILNSILSEHGITLSQPLDYGGMTFKVVKSEINFRSYWIPTVTVFFSAIFVCIFPAIKAARTKPAEAMRIF